MEEHHQTFKGPTAERDNEEVERARLQYNFNYITNNLFPFCLGPILYVGSQR